MKRDHALVVLLTLIALALRFAAAAGMDYWVDDVGTLVQAHRIDSVQAALVATTDWHPPLSFLFTKLWLALAGLRGAPGEELRIRAPFLVVGALAVPLAWLVARRFVKEPRWALAVALGVAVHPLLVWSDRDIRGYALLVPLALAATLFWLRAQESKSLKDWAGFVIFAALAWWDHYNAIPFVAVLLLLSLLEGQGKKATFAGAAVLVLFAAWLPAMKEHLTTINFAKHQAHVQLAIQPVAVTAPCYVLFGMTLGYSVFPWNLVVVIPTALAAGWLVVRGLVAKRAAALGVLLPVIGAAFTSFKMPRYHVASVPFLLVVLACGAERSKRGKLLAAILLAAFVFSDVELLRGREHHFLFPLHPWREAARRVHERPAPVLATAGPFRWVYVRDLADVKASDEATAPVGSACWLLVDEAMSEKDEDERVAQLGAAGFHNVEDTTLLTDPENAARTRWVHRGTREKVVRLLRFER